MPNTVRATTWLQIEPTYPTYGNTPNGAKVVRSTQKEPDYPLAGTVLVKLNVNVPVSAFEPLGVVNVDIPEELTRGTPIEVTAQDPDDA